MYIILKNIVICDIKSILNLHKHVLIVGDLNSKSILWNCSNNNSNGVILQKFLCDHLDEFQLHFPETPTFYPGCPEYSPSVLDVAISKRVNIHHVPYTLDVFDSDHLPIIFKISTNDRYMEPNKVNSFNFAKANWKLYRESIDDQIQHNILINNEDELNYYTSHLTVVITNSLNISVPKFDSKDKQSDLTKIVKKMIKEKKN